ncbi:hypothetical protein [Neisseria yangbaofengii]|uniref:hypothetical protein n=1 Tax=Neisseria yangbaofengii TaxID=2709396 RepID=UPI0035309429
MKCTISHTVTLGKETHFHVSTNETVLIAVTRQNLNLPIPVKTAFSVNAKPL